MGKRLVLGGCSFQWFGVWEGWYLEEKVHFAFMWRDKQNWSSLTSPKVPFFGREIVVLLCMGTERRKAVYGTRGEGYNVIWSSAGIDFWYWEHFSLKKKTKPFWDILPFLIQMHGLFTFSEPTFVSHMQWCIPLTTKQ